MTEIIKRKAPRTLAERRVLEVAYDGGLGVEDLFRFHLSLATAAERTHLDTIQAESTSSATRRVRKQEEIFSAILEANLAARRRGELSAGERKTYEICFAHIHRVEFSEDGAWYEAELVPGTEQAPGKTWAEMSESERMEWAERHPGLWAPVVKAIMPTANGEIEGK